MRRAYGHPLGVAGRGGVWSPGGGMVPRVGGWQKSKKGTPKISSTKKPFYQILPITRAPNRSVSKSVKEADCKSVTQETLLVRVQPGLPELQAEEVTLLSCGDR